MTTQIPPKIVSIAMPTYNGASKFIHQAIQSCIDQTYPHWELVVVDDASTDNTAEVVANYVARDKRIRLVRHEQNRKLPGALNTAIRHATGDYFGWLSDDDLYRPQAFEVMVRYLETHPQIDWVYTDFSTMDVAGNPLERIVVGAPEELGPQKSTGHCYLHKMTIFDKVGLFDETRFLVEDLDFCIRTFMHFTMAPLHEDMFLYRQHPNSLTSTFARRVYPLHAAILEAHLPRMHWLNRDQRAYTWLRMTRRAAKSGGYRDALRYFVRALGESPGYAVTKTFSKMRE